MVEMWTNVDNYGQLWTVGVQTQKLQSSLLKNISKYKVDKKFEYVIQIWIF